MLLLEAGDAILRIHADLAPAAGQKILPPTYVGTVDAMTPARDDGPCKWCSVDSPASFANRAEAALYPERRAARESDSRRKVRCRRRH